MCFARALNRLLTASYEELTGRRVNWVVAGSAATRLQGVNLTPRDIDVLMQMRRGVFEFARLMGPFTPAACPSDPVGENEEWYSSEKLPILVDDPDPHNTTWTFGRWYIEGFKAEVAHIKPPADYLETKRRDSGIWECGPEVWPHVRYVSWEGYRVPVVPLEIQLHTSLNRGLDSRVRNILDVLGTQGFDRHLLELSLTEEQKKQLVDIL